MRPASQASHNKIFWYTVQHHYEPHMFPFYYFLYFIPPTYSQLGTTGSSQRPWSMDVDEVRSRATTSQHHIAHSIAAASCCSPWPRNPFPQPSFLPFSLFSRLRKPFRGEEAGRRGEAQPMVVAKAASSPSPPVPVNALAVARRDVRHRQQLGVLPGWCVPQEAKKKSVFTIHYF